MNIEIINVGTELLTGSILNTNSQFLSLQLSDMGFNVHNISTVGDNPERLNDVFKNALERNDIIIVTGGLGPTEDDLTKETIAKVLNKELIFDELEYEKLKKWFQDKGITFTSNNKKQALLPEGAIKIENSVGTAPGIYLIEDNKHIFLLPGPPSELKELYENTVKDILKSLSPNQVISRYYNLTGIGESQVEDTLLDIIDSQTNPTIATYAKSGEILIRVTANGEKAELLLDDVEKIIKERLEDYIFTYSNDSLEYTVGKYLINNNLTISTAESCTGGLIAERLTDIPGISKSFLLGLVTYANEAKEQLLHVNPKTLEKYGAVSEQTCREMCQNVKKILNTDIGIATTGIAGPDGGTLEKPVGLVYTGIATEDEITIRENHFGGNREMIRNRACKMIFQMILEKINTLQEK